MRQTHAPVFFIFSLIQAGTDLAGGRAERTTCVLLGKCGGKRLKASVERNPVLGNSSVIWTEVVNTGKVEISVDKPQQVPFSAGLG